MCLVLLYGSIITPQDTSSFGEGLPLATCCDIDQGRQIKSEEALTARATTADLPE